MTRRRAPVVTTATPIGQDVDLERDVVRLADGSRLTSEVAESIVEEVRHGGGRPSLSGAPARSPQIAFRVPPDIRQRVTRSAADEGVTVSQFAREALEARLNTASCAPRCDAAVPGTSGGCSAGDARGSIPSRPGGA